MPRLNRVRVLPYILIYIWFLISSGCNPKSFEPDKIISKDSIIEIIVDMHMGDAVLQEPVIQSKQFVVNKPEYYKEILLKHSVSKEDFEKSLDYYAQDQEEYEKIYDVVIEKITTLQGNFLNSDTLKKENTN